jgi:FAD/FMN-containing dehydrogenase
MHRRAFLKGAAASGFISFAGATRPVIAAGATRPFARVRPGDVAWPSQERWNSLFNAVGGRLVRLDDPLASCRAAPDGAACQALFKELRNPYFISESPALTETSGWVDAWNSTPSAYAVKARSTADVVAAVNFARENNLRLVIKGGGHSYQGTSDAPDSLLIWTREMSAITLHDSFIPVGCDATHAPQPAVTVETGARWLAVYDAVTTRGGRYVQGGGCTTVGVAGFIHGGGFGSFSKKYGLGAAALLQAEIVTADGGVLVVNACNHPDLFWAIKGGGGGAFGVLTKLTLRTRELPTTFGAVFGTLRAASETAFHDLIAKTLSFYADKLFNPHWGEQIAFGKDKRVGALHLGASINEGHLYREAARLLCRTGAAFLGRRISAQGPRPHPPGRPARRAARKRLLCRGQRAGRFLRSRLQIGLATGFAASGKRTTKAGRCRLRRLAPVAGLIPLQ